MKIPAIILGHKLKAIEANVMLSQHEANYSIFKLILSVF